MFVQEVTKDRPRFGKGQRICMGYSVTHLVSEILASKLKAPHLENELAEQLVFQAGLCDCEVNKGDLGRQLGRVMRPRQARCAVQLEAIRHVNLQAVTTRLSRVIWNYNQFE